MEFRVPELGEGVYEAELVEWLVQPGQGVRRGDHLAEVMTDKATMELPSPFSGTVDTLLAEPGETIEVGQLLLKYSVRGFCRRSFAVGGRGSDPRMTRLRRASPAARDTAHNVPRQQRPAGHRQWPPTPGNCRRAGGAQDGPLAGNQSARRARQWAGRSCVDR